MEHSLKACVCNKCEHEHNINRCPCDGCDQIRNLRLLSVKEDWIYLAGIIDGEGSIGIEHLAPDNKSRKKDYYVCRLTVVNTSFELMNELKCVFGGQFDKRKDIEGRKKCYRWHIFGKDLEETLRIIKPYLLIKRKQADVVLEYRKTVGKTGWNVSDEVLQKRKELWLRCKELNRLG